MNEQFMHHLAKERLARLNALVDFVKKRGNVKIDEVIGYMGLEFGLSERKIREYLKQLEVVGKLLINYDTGAIHIPIQGEMRNEK